MRRALPRNSRPSTVSSTRRLVRENKAKPSLRSNSRIRAYAGCDTLSSAEARVNDSSSATVTKMRYGVASRSMVHLCAFEGASPKLSIIKPNDYREKNVLDECGRRRRR